MRTALIALLPLLSCTALPGRPRATAVPGGPDEVVVELYDLVTFGPGEPPDWDAVRALFAPEAVVVLRTGRDRMSTFTLEGFVDDFVRFIEDADVLKTGFTERILDLRTTTYGDIAHVLVRFDSHLPGSGRRPHEGIDSFQLVRSDGGWRILSIVNERPDGDLPSPASVFGR